MDFGTATFDNTSVLSHDEKSKHSGSGFTKQQRSVPDDHPLFLQTSKTSRTDYFDHPNKSMSLRSDSLLSLSAADANNMLSFSSSSSANATNQTSLFSFYQPSPACIRNTVAGYGYGGLQTGMHMPVSRYKGPFTPSQWMDLEHQALIYKHFVANVPVPSNLLHPLLKSVNTFPFPGSSSSTSFAPNSYGWGSFHLGFSGSTDPEPGRCRRTDGKKWRCSRDAVADQKYCERHINRGRHRSRKPVESQNGQAVSGPAASKVGPVVSSSSVPVSTTLATATALTGAALHHSHGAHGITSSTQTPVNRSQDPQAFAINPFSVPKQSNPIEESSDSLMYPTNYSSFLDHGVSNTNPLPNFVDEWSKDEPLKPDWTQLSMSIPMASSDFSSSSNSPAQEKLAVPPLGLTPEFDLNPTQKQASNWIPISWGNPSSMGGPLGEVLNRTSSSNGVKCKNPSSGSETNHMSEMWDAVSYHMGSGSSPTGVLQKTTFVSLSNSSSGSSPKKDEHGDGGAGGGSDQLLLSTLASIT